jgi:hypothetical protein
MTAPTFAEAVARINQAHGFGDLVSDLGGEPADAYRRLVKIVHPDVAPASRTRTATQAFARLSALWAERDGRTMTTGRGTYRVGALVTAGDIANLYAVDDALLKLPRRPADNDLMAAEARALSRLETDGDPRHRAYGPRLIESFTHEDPTGVRRTVNVLERLSGFVPLAQLRRQIDPRDAAWMWRRLLAGLGWAHRAGVVHGAVLPGHILIHPAEHGLALVDWCYSVAPGERIPALVTQFRDFYPPEVPAREAATPATDIYLATAVMRHIVKDPPAAMRRFIGGCLYDAPRMRPQDAWQLLAELDELLENLYGPRTFRPFTI